MNSKERGGEGRRGELNTYVRRKVLPSSHAESVAWRFSTNRAKRRVVTTQLLGGFRCRHW